MLWIAALPGTALGQEGLVLGGGGARGLAHGGVVVGMEHLGRDPTIVVGASMGAIVGGLYAAGYDPDTIWRIIVDEDWPKLFTAMPWLVGPDREIRYPVLGLEVGEGGLPQGLVPDWRINRRLVQLLFDAQARSRGNFDRLPRRFRSVAADLSTGRMVALGSGDLARAIRASMSVPGAFAPVAWGEGWLVDGGINNYLPIPVARDLGADRVIAVDVIRPPLTPASLDPIPLALRGLRLVMLNTLPAESPPDVLILPKIEPGMTEAAFPRDPRPLLRAGLDAALANLRPGVAGAAVRRTPLAPPDSLGALRIDSPEPGLARLAQRAFEKAVPAPYDPDRVLGAVDRLYETGLFTGVWPAVESDDEDAPTLTVRLEPTRTVRVTGAAGWENDRGFRGWLGFRSRFRTGTPTELGLEISGQELDRWAALSTRIHSTRHPPLAWTAGGHAREAEVRIFEDDELLEPTIGVQRLGGWLGAERRRLSPDLAVVGAVRAEHVDVEAGANGAAIGPYLRIGEMAPLTRPVGLPSGIEAEARFGTFDYRRARATGALYATPGRAHLAVLADLALVRGDAPPDVVPALGDEHLVPALRWQQFRGRTRAVVGADIAYPGPIGALARLRLRGGTATDGIRELDESDRWIGGAELGVIWATPAGPILVAASTNTRGDWRIDLNIGPIF